MRQRVTYCITGSPTSSVNRAANAERDIASSSARAATVQARAGSPWIRESARPICSSRRAPSQPVCALGSVSIHQRIAWMMRTSASRVMTASPPGRRCLRLGGDQRQRPLHPDHVRRARGVEVDDLGQQRHEVARGRVVEAHRAAHHPGERAAAAVAQHLVAVGDLLPRQVEDSRRRRRGIAAQPVAGALGDEREVAAVKGRQLAVAEVERDPAGGHDVEPQVVGQRRQRQAPGLGELGAAVEGAAHPQRVERFSERVAWRTAGFRRSMRELQRLVDLDE